MFTLQAHPQSDSSSRQTGVRIGMSVRRLTPTECERLQGFPDGWTAIKHRKKPAADGPRYKALGNSMAVPVLRWIGERIMWIGQMTDREGEL
jgi:DNA (cytosine-5)-methyltransferase 1